MGGSAVAGDVLRAAFRDRSPCPSRSTARPSLPAYAGPHTPRDRLLVLGRDGGDAVVLRGGVERGCPDRRRSPPAARSRRPCDGRGPRRRARPRRLPAAGGARAPGVRDARRAASRSACCPRSPTTCRRRDRRAGAARRRARPRRCPSSGNAAKALAALDRRPRRRSSGAPTASARLAAMRWKTQMNENGKVPAWAASMPELDHNEVVGWSEPLRRAVRSWSRCATSTSTPTSRCGSRSRSRSCATPAR